MTDKPTLPDSSTNQKMIVFVIVALQPLITMSDQAGQMRIWALVVTAFFAGTALTMPQLLTPLSKL